MARLGEELPEAEQADATPFAPRTVKDLVEERLFARRHDLFTDLSVVFMDMVLRTPATGSIGTVFKAAGVALPANVRDAPAP